MNSYADIDGPVFLPDPTLRPRPTPTRGRGRRRRPLVHRRASCSSTYSNSTLATAEHIDITPGSARGGICTHADLGHRCSPRRHSGAADQHRPRHRRPPRRPARWLRRRRRSLPGCRVFSPGRYTTSLPDLGGADRRVLQVRRLPLRLRRPSGQSSETDVSGRATRTPARSAAWVPATPPAMRTAPPDCTAVGQEQRSTSTAQAASGSATAGRSRSSPGVAGQPRRQPPRARHGNGAHDPCSC